MQCKWCSLVAFVFCSGEPQVLSIRQATRKVQSPITFPSWNLEWRVCSNQAYPSLRTLPRPDTSQTPHTNIKLTPAPSSAMGKSRSATATCAYLMHRYAITPTQALAQIRQARPLCEPNEGFWQQLELYHSMATPDTIAEVPAYQRWLYQREIELSRACGQAPEAEKIRFEDEHVPDAAAADFELRCRKCR